MKAVLARGATTLDAPRDPRLPIAPMPHASFTKHLARYFPTLEECDVEGTTVAEVVAAIDRKWPGLAGYLVDDQGALRKHVNVFVNEEPIHDRRRLSDAVTERDEVHFLQALSGGAPIAQEIDE